MAEQPVSAEVDATSVENWLEINGAELPLIIAAQPGDDGVHVAVDLHALAQAHAIDQGEFRPLEQRPALAEKARRRLDEDRLHRHARMLGDQCKAALELADRTGSRSRAL